MNYLADLLSSIGNLADDFDAEIAPNSVKRVVALAILVEADLDDVLKAKQEEPEIKFEPDEGVNVAFKPEIKRKNGRKNCKECGTRLTGQKRMFCSKICSKRNWTKNNRDKTRAYYKKHYKKQKAQLTLVK